MVGENSVSNHDSLAVTIQKEMQTPNLTIFKEGRWAIYVGDNDSITHCQRATMHQEALCSPLWHWCIQLKNQWPHYPQLLACRLTGCRHLQQCQLNKSIHSLYPCYRQEHCRCSSILEGKWQCCLGGTAVVGEFSTSEGSSRCRTQKVSRSCSGSCHQPQICPSLVQDNSQAPFEHGESEKILGKIQRTSGCKEHLEQMSLLICFFLTLSFPKQIE